MDTRVRDNPFPGLRPFFQEEADLFFGRDRQSDELVRRLATRRLLAVVGSSGSGKSSLVRAGLLSSLEGGLMAGAGAHWSMATLRPQNDPIGFLARAMVESGVFAHLELPQPVAEALVETTLRRSGLGVIEAVRLARLEAHENLLILVDQFEELFRFADMARSHGSADDAPAFVRLLLEATQQTDVPVYVVITMRSDFLGDCDRFRGLPEAISDSQYLVPRLTRDELQAVITGPIGVRGGQIAPTLVQRLLNDVGDSMDQLPVLQHALMRAWDHCALTGPEGRPIELSDLEAIGGMTEALSRHLEEAYASLTSARERTIAERLFKCLTERGPDNREIRRPTTLSRIAAIAGAEPAEIVRVIDVFRAPGRAFLMPPASVPLTGDAIVDISHESLIRQCARLRGWVAEEAESRATYLRLVEAASLHDAGKAGLWREPDLTYARQWQQRESPNATWAEQYGSGFDAAGAFLVASEAAHAAEEERERQHLEAERLGRERELEQAKALAEAQRQRADEQAAASLRQRRLTWGLAAILVLALGAAGFGWRQSRRADEQAALATQNAETASKQKGVAEVNAAKAAADRDVAVAAREEAKKAAGEAETARGEAQRQTSIATARRLATEALSLFGPSADELAVSGMVAVKSLEADATTDGRRALAQVLRLVPLAPEIVSNVHVGPVLGLAFSLNGRWMASTGQDGSVVIWDLVNQKKRTVLERQFDPAPVQPGLVFSDDGRWLVAGSNYALWIWSTETGRRVQDPISSQFVRSIAFSPDGLRFAAAERGGSVRLFARAGETWVESKPVLSSGSPRKANGVVFLSSDTLALAGSSGPSLPLENLWSWNLDAGKERMLDLGRDTETLGECRALSRSGDSLTLAAICERGILMARRTDAGLERAADRPSVAAGAFSVSYGLALNGNGTNVAAKANDGVINVFGEPITSERTRMFVSGVPARSVAFRPDGRVVAAGLENGSVVFWPTSKGAEAIPSGHDGAVGGLAFSHDARWLVTAGDNSIRAFEVSTGADAGSLRQRLSIPMGPGLRSPAFSPDDRFVAVLDEKALQVFGRAATPWKALTRLAVGAEAISTVFSPKSRFLLVFEPNLIRILDTGTWQEKPRIRVDRGGEAAISPDGQFLTYHTNRLIRKVGRLDVRQVWRLSDGVETAWREEGEGANPARPARGGPQQLIEESATWTVVNESESLRRAGAWSAEMESSSPTLTLFNESGTSIAKLEHDGPVTHFAFSPGGRWLASSSQDGTLRLWPLQVKDLLVQACKLLPRNLTAEEWKALSLDGPYRKSCPSLP